MTEATPRERRAWADRPYWWGAGAPRAFAAAMVASLAVYLLLRRWLPEASAGAAGVSASLAVFFSYRPRWWARPHRAAALGRAAALFGAYLALRALWP